MKVQLQTETIQKKLSFVNHAISPKGQLPILANILLEAIGKKLILRSTDLEIAIETTIPADVLEEGRVAIPAKTFIELIASFPPDTITMESENGKLQVYSKKTKSVFQTYPSDDFPKLYEEKGQQIAQIQIKDLHSDFSSVVFSASIDSTRPELAGVLLEKEEKGFLLVATDGYRLSLKHMTTKFFQPGSEEESLIVPARVFKEVLNIKEESDEIAMYIAKGSNQILFEQNQTILLGRLIESKFPDYQRIIPSDYSATISFDREELQKAVKICSIFARESANIIKLSLRKDKIIVSSQTPSVGENTVDVEAVLKGEENEIAFNARYLQDVLANIEANELVMEMTGPLNPGVFKIKDDDSFLHLIMPIRIQG